MYVAIGLTFNDERDIFGIWAGEGGEDAKFWLSVLTEVETRGVGDICIVVCDGLKRLPEAINPVWELAVVQTRIIHLIRNTFRFASRKYWDEMSRDLRPVYTAPSESAARERFTEFTKNGINSTLRSSRRETTRRQSSCAFRTATLKSSGESAGPSA